MKTHQSASPALQATTALYLGKHLVPYREGFSKPLCRTFTAFLVSLIASTDATLGTVGMIAGKPLSSAAYFLNEGIWDHRRLNDIRKGILANHPDAKPHVNDIACLDGSAIAKRGAHFEVLSRVHDGRDGLIKNGISFRVLDRESRTADPVSLGFSSGLDEGGQLQEHLAKLDAPCETQCFFNKSGAIRAGCGISDFGTSTSCDSSEAAASIFWCASFQRLCCGSERNA